MMTLVLYQSNEQKLLHVTAVNRFYYLLPVEELQLVDGSTQDLVAVELLVGITIGGGRGGGDGSEQEFT